MMRWQIRRVCSARYHVLALAGLILALSLSLLGTNAPTASAASSRDVASPPPKTTATKTSAPSPSTTNTAQATDTSTPVPTATSTLAPTVVATPAPTTAPTSPPTAPTVRDCLGDHPPSGSFIKFCTPVYDDNGDAGGPNGTHVIVIGQNKGLMPTALYFVQVDALHAPAVAACDGLAATGAAQADTQAFAVMCRSDISHEMTTPPTTTDEPFALTFILTTPQGAAGFDYRLVAIYPHQDPETSQMASFHVTSPYAPCVIAVQDSASGKSECSGQAPIFVQQSGGNTATIQGFNWLAVHQNIEVVVTGVCVTGQQCTTPRIILGSGTPDVQGTIQFPPQFPRNTSGIFALQAWSIVVDARDGSIESLADGALMFPSLDTKPQAAFALGSPTAALQDTSACSGAICTVPVHSPLNVIGRYWSTTPVAYIALASKPCTGVRDERAALPVAFPTRSTVGEIRAQISVASLKTGTRYRVCVNYVSAPQLIEVEAGPPGFASPLAWIALALVLASLSLYVLRPRGQTLAASQGFPRW